MRRWLIAGILTTLPAFASAARAQAPSYPMTMTIILPSVEARCGPSAKFCATSRLAQGQQVVVVGDVKDQPGWLEIRPPEGSFNWISAKNGVAVKLRQPGQPERDEFVVTATGPEPVPVMVGSAVLNEKPTTTKQPGYTAGYIVPIVGKPQPNDGETWYPITTHPKEVRYIPADAVKPVQAAVTAPSNWSFPGGKANPTQPGNPNNLTAKNGPPANDVRGVAGTATSFSPSPAPAAPATTNPPGTLSYPPSWSEYGILRQTTFTKDGQPMYALVDRAGRPLKYVTTRPGTSLASYVNQTICVYGPLVYRPDESVRMHYIIASHVAVP